MAITKKYLGTIDEKDIYEFTLKNKNNVEVSCLNYGGIITKILTADKNGNFENIVLNFDDFKDYKKNEPYLGAIIGRVGGRIKNAEFSIDGEKFVLDKNNGNNCLHGGFKGFNQYIWDVCENGESSLKLTCLSCDCTGGFPGNLNMEVVYTLNDEDEFIINYKGKSDKKTILNPTNHTYFNLSGNAKKTIHDHILKICADKFIEIDEELMPTGKLIDVKGTLFDFNEFRNISEGFNSDNVQNKIATSGYDHGFILSKNFDNEILAYDKLSGRGLIVETDAPCVVVYTSNSMGNNFKVNGRNSEKYLGLCLETQIEPDAINIENFSNCIIDKDEEFSSTTKYKFILK